MSATAQSVGSAQPVLVSTKLNVPGVRRGLVPRPGLVDRLISGEGAKLTLICAPAGWGKTVLLSEWCASPQERRAFAWVSLDQGDSDPVRFWRYVIGALRNLEPRIGDVALAELPTARAELVDAVVAPLLNDLAASSQELVLVLDDYHLVHAEAIHESVAYLLRRLPTNVHVAIASRGDPPFPLATLRARGEVTEVRAAHLGFSEAEAEQLLNGSLGLDLDDRQVELLLARTEGWAAGLRLAGLSVQAQDDQRAFIEKFAGDDRQIGDYLHEVLDDQPPAMRTFLLRTSILERLCAPPATPSPVPATRRPASRRSSARTCSSFHWTRTATGIATTTSSASSYATSLLIRIPRCWASSTGGPRSGTATTTTSTRRSRMPWPQAASTKPAS